MSRYRGHNGTFPVRYLPTGMSMQELLDWIERLPEEHDSHQKYIMAFNEAMRDLIAYGESAVEPLITYAERSNTGWMQWAVIWALREIGDKRGVDTLWSILQRSESHLGIQYDAIIALSMFKDERLFDVLVPLLHHENEHMGQLAVIAFGNLGDPRATELILPLLVTSDEPVRLWVIQALGKLNDERVFKPLIAQMPKSNFREKSAIIEAIGKISSAEAVDFLAAFIDSYDLQSLEPSQHDRLRAEATYALAQNHHPRALVVLQEALHHPKRGVRRAAGKALTKLHPLKPNDETNHIS